MVLTTCWFLLIFRYTSIATNVIIDSIETTQAIRQTFFWCVDCVAFCEWDGDGVIIVVFYVLKYFEWITAVEMLPNSGTDRLEWRVRGKGTI